MTNKNNQGINIEGGDNVIKDNTFNFNSPEKAATAVKYIPYPSIPNFVGRSDELIKIHEKFHKNNAVAISAVAGMGGVGKTELAVKYAREHIDDYPGGICWLNARDANIAAEIIQFVQLQMGLEVPQQDFQGNALMLNQQVAWCWQNWQPADGLVLVVFDDVTNLNGFAELLPTNDRFRVLITTRLRNLDTNIQEIPLDVLSPEEALELLINLVGEKRVNKPSRHCVSVASRREEERRSLKAFPEGSNRNDSLEVKDIEIASLRRNDGDCDGLGMKDIEIASLRGRKLLNDGEKANIPRNDAELSTAKELCKWLGYLPLGIELVGRYVVKKPPHFTLAKMLELLKQQRLHQEAINPHEKGLSTAQLGVLAAFEISWVELNQETQQVATLLSLFAADIFVWEWVKSMTQSLNWDESDVEKAIEQLYRYHLVQCLEEEGEYYYKIHPLIREFLQIKLIASTERNELKQAFANTFVKISHSIPESATLELINSIKNAIPHLTEVAENLTDVVSDEDLTLAFKGLAEFYYGQGLYTLAKPCLQQCVSTVKSRLGENHPDYATSLNNLALLYESQGKYEVAEPLYIQALKLRKQLLGENHPDYATSLNNLALLYYSQGKYEVAEPLYIKALELYRQLLGENHPDYATSLNNLALLYYSQGKYEVVEPLYIQALKLRKQLLGENHPDYASSLNNLALLYYSQRKYKAVAPLYIQALKLRKQLLGEKHPHYASSLNNLALLYKSQGRYDKAEPLFIEALKLRKQLLGEKHPNYASSLNNLAALYKSQGRYKASELLYIQALELREQLLGENHPDYATSLNNLAFLYYSQRRYDKAEPFFVQALEIAERVLVANHPNIVTFRKNLESSRTLQQESRE
jgi:tetratricopeptide (TPR) repeat protein